jgi:hypothetical protein
VCGICESASDADSDDELDYSEPARRALHNDDAGAPKWFVAIFSFAVGILTGLTLALMVSK